MGLFLAVWENPIGLPEDQDQVRSHIQVLFDPIGPAEGGGHGGGLGHRPGQTDSRMTEEVFVHQSGPTGGPGTPGRESVSPFCQLARTYKIVFYNVLLLTIYCCQLGLNCFLCFYCVELDFFV